MIKIRFVNMHFNRSTNINDPKSRKDDEAWMHGFNNTYTYSQDFTYKNLQLVMDNYDYLVVIDCCYRHFDNKGKKIPYFDESKAIVFLAEPQHLRDRYPKHIYDYRDYDKRFLRQYFQNCMWGWLGYNITQLINWEFPKTKEFSTIISANCITEGHLKRLLFLRDYLSKIDILDHFGDEREKIGCFTTDTKFSKNYKGYIDCKQKALTNYRYSFNSENGFENDYITEKLTDIILCEALPFYSGAPNIFKYFSEKAIINLNLDDPENALYIIKKSIRENEYAKRIDYIKQEKLKIINELNPLELIYKSLNGIKNYWE